MPMDPLSGLLDPKAITLKDRKDGDRAYIISEIPATVSREIFVKYVLNALPKVGDFDQHQAMVYKMMSYVAVPMGPGKVPLRLTTPELIDNHTDFKTFSGLETAMAAHNWDFFLPDYLSRVGQRISTALNLFLTQILTDSLRASSQPVSPPSESSKPSTP